MTNLIKEKKFHFEIPAGKRKERIDLFLSTAIENATRSRIQKLIEAEHVLVNSKNIKSSYSVQPGDIVDVSIPIYSPPRRK